jgi:glycosyltransferase involved in cell wall biosynthesis
MCTYGRTECINRLISSLETQSCHDFELIIVDQNPPGTLDAIVTRASQAMSVRYLRSDPGLSRARNVGIRYHRGTIVAFPDDDCWYPDNLIEHIISVFKSYPNLGIVTCRTVDASGKESNGKFLPSSCSVTRSNVWRAGNSNGVFARSAVVAATGGFDETLGVGAGTPFGAGEESDFLLRALAKGINIAFFHDFFTHHPQVNTRMDAACMKRTVLYSQGFGRTLRLNHYPWYYAVFRALRSAAAACLGLLRMDFMFARFKWIWACGTLKGFYWSPRFRRLQFT